VAREKTKEAKISDYVMGISLCAVTLSDGRAGVAYTDRKAIPWGCSIYDELPKVGVPAEEFINMFDSNDTLTRSLGMATINACINEWDRATHNVSPTSATKATATKGTFKAVDVMEEVEMSKSDVVGMVGYFDPMIDDIKKQSKELYIFEQERMPETFSPEKIPELLPKCDVLLISATTIMNRTYDSIIKYAKTNKVVILGPSTPICPEAFPEVKVFGATIVTPDAIKIVYHGGGTRNLYKEKAGKKVTLVVKN